MDTFKIIIAGSRTFKDYKLLKEKMEFLTSGAALPIEVVTGMAEGADLLGRDWAIEKHYLVEEFPAQWEAIEGKPAAEIGTNKHGRKYWKKAGFIRNEQMACYADACVIFWDGKSTGTEDMRRRAEKHLLPVRVVLFTP